MYTQPNNHNHQQVDAMPTLEVCSGDVDCTHGATVADIDENEAFYLQSRGIGRREVWPEGRMDV